MELENYIANNFRQSDPWLSYMLKMGWDLHTLSDGRNFLTKNVFMYKVAKMQRPLNLTEDILLEVFDICKKEKVLFIKIEPDISQDLEVFNKHMSTSKSFLSPSATLVHDLKLPFDQIANSFDKVARNSISNAQRQNFIFKVLQKPSDEDLSFYYKEVIKEIFGRNKVLLPGFDSLIAQRDAFGDDSYLFSIYDQENNLIAAKFFLCDKITCLNMSGGTTKLGKKTNGNYLLVFNSIKYLQEAGYEFIDWDGVEDSRFKSQTEKWLKFSEFKYKFGGEKVYYPSAYINYFNPVLKFAARYLGLDF